jgi:molecular chaperone GrpE
MTEDQRKRADGAGSHGAEGAAMPGTGDPRDPAAGDPTTGDPAAPDTAGNPGGDAVVDVGPAEAVEDEGLTVLERELAELNDRHLRLAAEFENYRKRTREELRSSGARAQASLVATLLDAFDDFHRVTELDEASATLETVLEGVRMVERKLERALADAGVEWLDPAGEAFDPERMEAVMRVPATDEDEDDTVEQVFQRGVLLKGHLVRPARVTVRKLDG